MSKKQQLVDAAQSKVREGGYNNFSFRELAKEIGIKSASVHYHYPTKEDLGAEVARQYTDSFIAELGDPSAIVEKGESPIVHYAQQFRQALLTDKKMCLCGMLGAESEVLPLLVQKETKRFFQKNLQWLEHAVSISSSYTDMKKNGNEQRNEAVRVLSLLEGAMMISIALEDYSVFDQAIANLK